MSGWQSCQTFLCSSQAAVSSDSLMVAEGFELPHIWVQFQDLIWDLSVRSPPHVCSGFPHHKKHVVSDFFTLEVRTVAAAHD